MNATRLVTKLEIKRLNEWIRTLVALAQRLDESRFRELRLKNVDTNSKVIGQVITQASEFCYRSWIFGIISAPLQEIFTAKVYQPKISATHWRFQPLKDRIVSKRTTPTAIGSYSLHGVPPMNCQPSAVVWSNRKKKNYAVKRRRRKWCDARMMCLRVWRREHGNRLIYIGDITTITEWKYINWLNGILNSSNESERNKAREQRHLSKSLDQYYYQ